MPDPVIRVENLGKRYRLGQMEPYGTLRDAIARAVKAPFRTRGARGSPQGGAANPDRNPYIWALRNVTFRMERGEALGVIGPNGAGKTTLLKILSRITEPTEGRAEIRGHVGSLLEVGTGFHPELTGKENISLNGAILGMTKREIEAKLEDIVSFAGLEDFMDTPVKRYSSGMHVRLAFAVAAHLEPEILLVDEILSVGDVAFQRKSIGKMSEVVQGGRTVLFVSHNLAAVENLCSVALLLDHGKVTSKGVPSDVIANYLEQTAQADPENLATRKDRQGSGKLRFTRVTIRVGGREMDTVQCGAPVEFSLDYHGTQPLTNVNVAIGFYSLLGERVLFTSSEMIGQTFAEAPSSGSFVCRFEKFPLLPAAYSANVHCSVNRVVADWILAAFRFQVVEGDYFGTGKLPPKGYGHLVAPHAWQVIS